MLLQKKLLRTRNHLETSKIHVIRTGFLSTNSLVVSLGNKEVFVVDPADCKASRDENKILDYLKANKLECLGIVLTHSHFDHIMGLENLKKAFPKAPILIHQAEAEELQNPPGPMNRSLLDDFCMTYLLEPVSKLPAADILLQDKQTLECIADYGKNWTVIHTPGHTPGSICLYNQKDNILISGDTLFADGGYGRTDMYGGNYSKIAHSLAMLKVSIPSDTKVYPGHEAFGFFI